MSEEMKKDEVVELSVVPENQAQAISPMGSNSMMLFPTKEQIDQYKEFLENYDSFISSVLNDGVDFGKIPGVDKPSLLKPGAEKLEKLLFLTHKKDCVEKIVEPGFIKYTYRTTVFDNQGRVKATCEGTANSKEKKYRYTTVYENQATPEQIEKGVKITKKSRAGSNYTIIQIEKDDYYDVENTIMKMAQKRSYVGAILEATNSSGRFTQDVEDMDLPGNQQDVPRETNKRTLPAFKAPIQTVKPLVDDKLAKEALKKCINRELERLGQDEVWLGIKIGKQIDELSVGQLEQVFEQLKGLKPPKVEHVESKNLTHEATCNTKIGEECNCIPVVN